MASARPVVPRRRGSVFVAAMAAMSLGVVACGDPVEEVDDELPVPELAEADLDAKPPIAPLLVEDRGDPPDQLYAEDLAAGDGDTAIPGRILTVHFVGGLWSTGAEFDATWDRGQPYTFPLGEGRVIPGWDQGLVGMREGGRRILIVPPDLGYGDRGAAAAIGPGETLVFVVDLLAVEEASG